MIWQSIRNPALFWCGLLLWVLSGCAQGTLLTRSDFHLYSRLGNGAHPSDSDSLLCVSYNIEYGENLEQALQDLTADPLLCHPDVILLQEMDPDGVAFIAASLGMNYCYYPSFIHPHHGRLFGTAVLSPWSLGDPRSIVLPYPNPLTENRRTALAVDVMVGSRVVRAVSVHLSTLMIDLEDRLEQATIVRDSLVGDTGIAIIGGDFNTGTRWEEVLFRRVARRGGFKEARFHVERTARGGPLDLVGHHLKLDHIYYRDLELVATGVSKGATASDHFPVWSLFRWRN